MSPGDAPQFLSSKQVTASNEMFGFAAPSLRIQIRVRRADRPTPRSRRQGTLEETDPMSAENRNTVSAIGWQRALVVGTVLLSLAAAQGTAYAGPKPATSWVPASTANYTSSGSRSLQYVVIHDIEGGAPGAISWFQNSSASASAHYVIGYEGHITQMVADNNIAWHAGNWTYNSKSIGIEHAGYASSGGFTTAEYTASANLVRWICDTYGIPKTRSRIIGHNEVPDPDGSGYGGAGHHTDPGAHWNWTYFMSLVTGGSTSGGGTVAPPPPPAPPAPPSSGSLKAMKVTAASLNVRSGPGTGNAIIGGIPSGQVYVSMSSSGAWKKIWYRGNTGWCSGDFLSQVGASGRKVTTGVLNVRSGPSTGTSIVGQAHSGEVYVTIGTSGVWRKIYFGGGTRWFSGDFTSGVGL
ncbi:MAG: N-acetylmuramoyl-L-alanine amidase [Planctomycetes bacterium]|nr:N-acetylmuramoyl-L-alanine amidase [Planctomycetota bacterium]